MKRNANGVVIGETEPFSRKNTKNGNLKKTFNQIRDGN